MKRTIEFLNNLANRLDRWAAESRSAGWSTHQVQENVDTANECRREAARLQLEWKQQVREFHAQAAKQ
jgi:hypothetical protein